MENSDAYLYKVCISQHLRVGLMMGFILIVLLISYTEIGI